MKFYLKTHTQKKAWLFLLVIPHDIFTVNKL